MTREGEKSAGGRWLPFKGVAGDSREGGPTAGMPCVAGQRGAWL
jgi:hypothetical protein